MSIFSQKVGKITGTCSRKKNIKKQSTEQQKLSETESKETSVY